MNSCCKLTTGFRLSKSEGLDLLRLAAVCAPGSSLTLSCWLGFACGMTDWQRLLEQLEIPDGAVAGLSASDKPTLRGRLLQRPAEDRALFSLVRLWMYCKHCGHSCLRHHQVRLRDISNIHVEDCDIQLCSPARPEYWFAEHEQSSSAYMLEGVISAVLHSPHLKALER